MPRPFPTRGGLGVREFHNGHPSNIRFSDLPFLALYDEICLNLPYHPSVSNIKQALLLEVGNFAKETSFSQALLSWKRLVFFNCVLLYIIEQLKLCSRKIHCGFKQHYAYCTVVYFKN